MGRVAWYPTMWNAQERRPASKLLARRVARRGRPEFKATFPRRYVIGDLVIIHERPRFVPEELFVYGLRSALRERRGGAVL
jgi:hypothetical protein